MPNETEEYLTRCVVDTTAKKFYIYSNEGDDREIKCDTVDQFMNVLQVVRAKVDEENLVYSDPF